MREFDYNEDFNDLGLPWAGHRYFVKDLVETVVPKIIVELGTWRGTSMFSMLQGVKNKKLETEFYAIDTWEGDKHAGHYEGEQYLEEINSILQKHYPNCRVRLIRKRFEQAVSDFSEQTIDILHIDGLHTYEAVKNDFYSWASKVKNNGIILLHDISERKDDFGVFKLWDELKKDNLNYCFSYAHSHGLGILTREPEMSKVIYNLKQDRDDVNFSKVYTELKIDREYKERELDAIHHSRYWKLKEKLNRILGR